MLRTLRSRRRPRFGAHVCALIAALLLLLSVSLLHTRLSQPGHILPHHQISSDDAVFIDPLLSDSDDDTNGNNNEDKIDELDTLEENDVVSADEEKPKISSSGYYFDHITGSIRRAFNKRSIDDWDFDYSGFTVQSNVEDKSKAAFGSDDIPVDDEVRRKMTLVKDIEDALLLKIGKGKSPLRDKWGEWFDKKSDFLRRDKMFKLHLEVLNPMNNPLLQDPDWVGVSRLTRGDKVVQKLLLNEFKHVSFIGKKPLGVLESNGNVKFRGNDREGLDRRSEIKRAERGTLDDNVSNESYRKRANNAKENVKDESNSNAGGELHNKEVNDSNKWK